ncbi:MAG: hypothetical protein KJ749_09075 [Planctomycetes bacterium]|nr:hypothetical protein [Planctomycetota bacterium]
MRKGIFAVMLVAILGYSSLAFGQTSARKATAADSAASRTRLAKYAARELLRKSVAEVSWEEDTFETVIDWLNDLGNDQVNIVPKWGQLANEGVDVDSPVTLKLRNTTVAKVFNEIIEQLSEEGRITYHAIDNNLEIATKQYFDRKLYRRVYDVSDLLFQAPDMGRSAPTVDLEQASRAGGQGGGGSGQSIFGGGGSSSSEDLTEEGQEVEERLEALRTLIQDTISPESWDRGEVGGGGLSRIRMYGQRNIVVLAPIEIHEEIAGFFVHD